MAQDQERIAIEPTDLSTDELAGIQDRARRWYMMDAGTLGEDLRRLLVIYEALSVQFAAEQEKVAELKQYRIDHPAFGHERCEHDVLLTEDCSQCPDPDADEVTDAA